MSLSLEVLDSLDGLRAIEPEWRAVWQRDAAATPFEGPDWLLPWTERLWGGGKLRVLAMREGRDLVALAPLFLWGYGSRPEIVRVSLLGAGITDHLGIVAAPEFEIEAARMVFGYLEDTAGQWHVCDLEELRPGAGLLCAGVTAGLTAREAPCGICPVLSLPPSYDALLATLAPKFRRNLHQAETRLSHARAEFVRARAEDAPEVMAALFRLHGARWSERQEPGMLAGDALQRFHLDAAERLAAHDLLRLFALQLDGEVIAVQYNLRRDRSVYAYLSGFDPAHARISPGSALLAYSIRSAIEEGAAEFDFLRKREEFKYQWGGRDRANRKLLLAHSAAYARDVA